MFPICVVASHAEVKGHIATLLSEYQASRDVGEARRCLHSLAVPFFHHELVKQARILVSLSCLVRD